jgi:hypothetical protein
LTEWTVSGPEGGIAITPVANTEYHSLLEGGGVTGCGIDTKVELRKISEKYHFLIDKWHCINSLEISIKYNILVYLPGPINIMFSYGFCPNSFFVFDIQ